MGANSFDDEYRGSNTLQKSVLRQNSGILFGSWRLTLGTQSDCNQDNADGGHSLHTVHVNASLHAYNPELLPESLDAGHVAAMLPPRMQLPRHRRPLGTAAFRLATLFFWENGGKNIVYEGCFDAPTEPSESSVDCQ